MCTVEKVYNLQNNRTYRQAKYRPSRSFIIRRSLIIHKLPLVSLPLLLQTLLAPNYSLHCIHLNPLFFNSDISSLILVIRGPTNRAASGEIRLKAVRLVFAPEAETKAPSRDLCIHRRASRETMRESRELITRHRRRPGALLCSPISLTLCARARGTRV